MGQYAKEMDPSWGKPSAAEIRLNEIEDEAVRNLARALLTLTGSNINPDLYSSIDALKAIRLAEAINKLITARLDEILSPVSPIEG